MGKRILLSISICFIVNINMFAEKTTQDSVMHKEKTRFGVKLGGQISAVDEIHNGSNKRVPCLTIGITMLMPLQKGDTCRIYFAPELLYYQGGEKGNDKDGNRDVKFYMDYVELPLLFKRYFWENKLIFVELGPKLSYMINHKNKDKDLAESKKFDIGLCLGGGVNLGTNNNFEIGARLNYGLVDIFPDIEKKNNNVSGTISLTYLF